MPIVTLKINNVAYQVACGDGEEAHLEHLARSLEEKVKKIGKSNKANDNKILLLAALMLEDEVFELKQQVAKKTTIDEKEINLIREKTSAHTLDAITEYVNNLVSKLEKI